MYKSIPSDVVGGAPGVKGKAPKGNASTLLAEQALGKVTPAIQNGHQNEEEQ